MYWTFELPKESGSYVVTTITPLKRENVMKSRFNAETQKWGFNNQIFVKYLVE